MTETLSDPRAAPPPSLRQRWAARLLGVRVGTMEALIRSSTRDGKRPVFDPGALPWTAEVEAEWQAIRTELDALLVDRVRIPAFHEVSEEQRPITDDDGWKTFVFRVFGTPVAKNCARCPVTAALLERIPGLCNAMFSILAPGKRIPPHRGPYNGVLRYHLGLKIPAARERCVIHVGGIRCTWEEGRTLIFDDSFEHAVNNDTPDERVVLFADFERPLPWPLCVCNRAVIAALARSPLARAPLERFERGEL